MFQKIVLLLNICYQFHNSIIVWALMCVLLASGCGHCKKMKPEYDEAAEILNKAADVSFLTFLYVQHAYRPVCFLISHSAAHTDLCGRSSASLTLPNNPSSWPEGFLAAMLVAVSCSPPLDVFLISRVCSSSPPFCPLW